MFWPQSFQVLKSPLEYDTDSEMSMSRQSQVCYSPSESEESFKKKPAKKSRTEEANSYKCSHCSYAEIDWYTFESHSKIMHRVPALFACAVPKCFRFFLSKNGLKGHCTRAHKEELTCDICEHVALGPTLLKDHVASHNLKKFKCDFCLKGFGSKFDKQRHHLKCQQNPNRAITCKKCLEKQITLDVTGAEDGLVIHIQKEHGMKGDWLCLYCHRLYVTEKNFDKHVDKCKKVRGKKPIESSTETETETDS